MKLKHKSRLARAIAPIAGGNGHAPAVAVPAPTLKLDLGCGSQKREGFTGVDSIAFPGVDVVTDLRRRWPWDDNSVAEVHSSHFVEHLWNTADRPERVHFCNELYRVLVPGGRATIITPHWASCRAYGDFTHAYPPVSEFWMYYLKREWRLGDPARGLPPNAPHNDFKYNPNGYDCDFDVTWGYGLHPQIQLRSSESQQFACQFYKEAIQDIIATFTKPILPSV